MEETNPFILDEVYLIPRRPTKEILDRWINTLRLLEEETIRIEIVGYESFIGLHNETLRNGKPGCRFAVKVSKKNFESQLLLLLSKNEDWGLVMEDGNLQFEERDS